MRDVAYQQVNGCFSGLSEGSWGTRSVKRASRLAGMDSSPNRFRQACQHDVSHQFRNDGGAEFGQGTGQLGVPRSLGEAAGPCSVRAVAAG